MSAVALSPRDEEVLKILQRALNISSKAQVVHQALMRLRESVVREKRAQEIQKSVGRCGAADLKEHHLLTEAANPRKSKE